VDMYRLETFKIFKGVICKKIVESSLREETYLTHNPSTNRRLTFYCTNSLSVLSIRCCINIEKFGSIPLKDHHFGSIPLLSHLHVGPHESMTCGVHGIYLKFGSFNVIDLIVP
jgi:hypothetical protein